MGCNNTGDKKKATYTGNQVGDLNHVGDFNFVAGGPPGSGISAGTTVVQVIPNGLNRRPWLREDAKMDDSLLDAAYPQIELQWFAEIALEPGIFFRLSDKPFYVQDSEGLSRYYDPRIGQAPQITNTVGEWLSPNYQTSDCTIVINNRDGFFNKFLPGGAQYRQWTGATVTIKVGFGEKYDNYFTIFEGQVTTKQGLTSDRDTFTVKAYDKLDNDEVPIPPSVFDINTYPDIDSAYAGKSVPLVYGDWTTDVSDFGSVVGVCVNSTEYPTTGTIFKVSDIELQSIDEIWLNRGDRKEGEPGGPIKILLDNLVIDLANGQFTIPTGIDVLETEISYSDGTGGNNQAGPGSGLNLITAKDSTVNFQSSRVQVGDRLVKTSTNEVAFVTQVLSTQLDLSGGVIFAEQDEYVVYTSKYVFIKDDKISLKCRGKLLNLISTKRLSDIDVTIQQPTALSFDLAYTFWIADDATQKIYRIGRDNVKLLTINYADIDVALTDVTSVSAQGSDSLWIVSKGTSRIYRYDVGSNSIGLSFSTTEIVGIASVRNDLQGIALRSDNRFWLYDNDTGDFWLVDSFTAVQPFVVSSFNRSVFDSTATEILDISYDEVHTQIIAVDRTNNKVYRVSAPSGALVSSFLTTQLASNVNFITGVSVAQDESVFYVDQGTLTIYNYNEQVDAGTNPAFIARDLLQKFGGHEYADFDINWNDTARQLSIYKCRVVLQDKTTMVSYLYKLLAQFNVVIYNRFGRFSLFYISFENFRANGRLTTEKDIKDSTFRPQKEMNQYFNSCSATYGFQPAQGTTQTSDTYVSAAGISFSGKETSKVIDMQNVYRREDLDRLVPLLVKLAVPEPEFVDVTFGFRLIRTQIQDFLTVDFDGDTNCATGLKDSGRRYDHVPCMVRQVEYDLATMTVSMKLWSLLTTKFPGWTPPGRYVGGDDDTVVLSNLGRLGRFSPTGTITGAGSGANTIVLEDADGANAETREATPAGLCWAPTWKCDIVDGATKEVLQTLTIASVTGSQIQFVEDLTVTLVPTTKNPAGFVTGGMYLQYSVYTNVPLTQRAQFGYFTKPLTNYPTSNTQEVEEQRAGLHSFDDGGLPYLIYPLDFVQY